MDNIRLLLILLIMILLLPVQACTNTQSNQQETVFKQLPDIKEIKPQKPVKIKLKRNATGRYSWELSGDDADKIIEIDRNLRRSLKETKALNSK